MRDDVVALLDRLGFDRVSLVGHSLGGAVALLVAQEHPYRVDRHVLEDAPPRAPATFAGCVESRPATGYSRELARATTAPPSLSTSSAACSARSTP